MKCNVEAEHIGPCGPDCILHDYFADRVEMMGNTPTVAPASDPAQQHFLVAVRHSEMPPEKQWDWVMTWAEEWQGKVDRLTTVARAAEKALRSYQCGNGSPDLAESIADAIARTLDDVPA
jgi:hypothetical protein